MHIGQCGEQARWVILFLKKLSQQNCPKFTKMTPNGYLIFEDESFLDSTVAKMNALRKSGQFCDVRLQVGLANTPEPPASVYVFKCQRFLLSLNFLFRICSGVALFRSYRHISVQPLGQKEPYVLNACILTFIYSLDL